LPARLCLSFLQQISSKACSHDDAPEAVNVNPHNGPDLAAKLPVLLGSRNNHCVHFTSFDDSPFGTPTKTGNIEGLRSRFSSDQSTSIDSDDPECSCSSSSWKLGVKNTFVHVSDDSDSDFELPVTRSKSEAPRSSLHSSVLQSPACEHFLASAPTFRSKLPSVGSALHGRGSCRPCAWFWKPEGSDDSPFAQAEVARRDRSTTDFSKSRSREIEVKNTFVHFSGSSDEEVNFSRCKTEPKHSASHSFVQQIQSCADLPTSLPESESKLPSVGSALHGTGSCKPCAWFWKVEGCANGAECRHCHICSHDEIKRRRKVMNSTRRRRAARQSDSQRLGHD
jgi:hypothetical protein